MPNLDYRLKYNFNYELIITTNTRSHSRKLPIEIIQSIPIVVQLNESLLNDDSITDPKLRINQITVPDYYEKYVESVLDYLENLVVVDEKIQKTSIGVLSLLDFMGFNIADYWINRYYYGHKLCSWYDVIYNIHREIEKPPDMVIHPGSRREYFDYDGWGTLHITVSLCNKDAIVNQIYETTGLQVSFRAWGSDWVLMQYSQKILYRCTNYIDYMEIIDPVLLTSNIRKLLYRDHSSGLHHITCGSGEYINKLLTYYQLKEKLDQLEKEIISIQTCASG